MNRWFTNKQTHTHKHHRTRLSVAARTKFESISIIKYPLSECLMLNYSTAKMQYARARLSSDSSSIMSHQLLLTV